VPFLQDPESIISFQGKEVKLRCSIRVMGELPEINWQRDGALYQGDVNQVLVPMSDDEWLAISELSIPSIHRTDAGSYQCITSVKGKEIISKEAQLEIEGLPHFTKEPQDAHVHRDEPFNLSCAAAGSPELKELMWLQDGMPVRVGEKTTAISPSTLFIQGLKKPATFRCEAHNAKGVATSRTANVKLLPDTPDNVTVTFTSSRALGVSWDAGFSGFIPFTSCTVQAEKSVHDLSQEIYLKDISVPPFSHMIRALAPHSRYRIRLACSTDIGASPWSSWVTAETLEGEPDTAPSNITFLYNGSALLFKWEKPSTGLNGVLQGYKVAYQDQDNAEVIMDNGPRENIILEVVLPVTNLTLCVAAYTKAGDGPWSDPVLVTLPSPGIPRQIRYPIVNTLGISDDLKEKLQDVMIDRHKLTLGKTLGEGEFGSVMEGQLNQDDYILKVAVKTMKRVCLQNHENEGFPSPVVILPFMKHGDLHSFLLYSRLGESPVYLPMQTLLKFMTDIARGMEYLSNKNFIHRDLAARNCMLNENMNVCVADFGLSKKIYNGDYYRQGRISKMPVKWIAIESLADRVYTTKSDVWSYGVTMWEIATRGQTPYPGVENSEIYDYLRQGNRLKQPPDCLDALYELMYYCWQLNPRERPTFEIICCQLEKIVEDLPPSSDPEEILYVNMEDARGRSDSCCEQGAVGGSDLEESLKASCSQFSKAPVVTSADVHQSNAVDRYVLCPPHESARLMAMAPLSSNSPLCLATEDLLLEEICGRECK
ncbi:hypothetical protein chiPu_0019450, partial [Chiloscyllium punctatum]|nr:hypothetical protein [Chiloscyllium punctatum]